MGVVVVVVVVVDWVSQVIGKVGRMEVELELYG